MYSAQSEEFFWHRVPPSGGRRRNAIGGAKGGEKGRKEVGCARCSSKSDGLKFVIALTKLYREYLVAVLSPPKTMPGQSERSPKLKSKKREQLRIFLDAKRNVCPRSRVFVESPLRGRLE